MSTNYNMEYLYSTLNGMRIFLSDPVTAIKVSSVYYDEAEGVTVVIWEDKTKTIVKTCEGDSFDKE